MISSFKGHRSKDVASVTLRSHGDGFAPHCFVGNLFLLMRLIDYCLKQLSGRASLSSLLNNIPFALLIASSLEPNRAVLSKFMPQPMQKGHIKI